MRSFSALTSFRSVHLVIRLSPEITFMYVRRCSAALQQFPPVLDVCTCQIEFAPQGRWHGCMHFGCCMMQANWPSRSSAAYLHVTCGTFWDAVVLRLPCRSLQPTSGLDFHSCAGFGLGPAHLARPKAPLRYASIAPPSTLPAFSFSSSLIRSIGDTRSHSGRLQELCAR